MQCSRTCIPSFTRIMVEKNFSSVIFANSNIPKKHFRVCFKEEEISELPENSQDIFRRSMLDRYKDRPNSSFGNGKYVIIDSMCYAEFLRYYKLTQITTNENDYQPEELTDQFIQGNHPFQHNYRKVISLMSSKEKFKCRKIPNVLQYYETNRHVYPENYYHHMIFMYYPFRREEELKGRSPPTYSQKFNEPEVAAEIRG